MNSISRGTLGGSSGDDESSFEDRISLQQKQSSSRWIEDGDAIESGDDDDGEASESAIEEDDAAWEDSDSESCHPSPVDKNLFQRVESQANQTSRRSMLTMQLHKPQRYTAIVNGASRSSPALRRSLPIDAVGDRSSPRRHKRPSANDP